MTSSISYRRPGRLLNALCTFNLRPVSTRLTHTAIQLNKTSRNKMIFSKRSSQPLYNKISICSSSQLTCHIHFFFIPTLILRNHYGNKILQFDTGSSFLVKIHIIFYCQYAKLRNAVYEKVHLDLLQNFLKIKLKAHSQLSLFLCFQSLEVTILTSHKNVSNMLCLIMKILTEKKP